MNEKILIVEDDPGSSWVLKQILNKAGYNTCEANSTHIAREILSKEDISLVLLDLRFEKESDRSGFDLLAQIKKEKSIPVIITTGLSEMSDIRRAMRLGAYDYILKPIDEEVILPVIKNALESTRLRHEVDILKSELSHYSEIIGISQAIKKVKSIIERIKDLDTCVLIEGESGTGKELVARAIHYRGKRAANPFVAINCGAIPKDLAESELFGHEKGAFTGAVARKLGKFELANHGTIFLDEICEMPKDMQVKLLRVLDNNEITRVGGRNPIKLDVRVIAATNRNIKEETQKGNFREDLFYRLNVIRIYLPPLRERKEDIPVLAQYFIEKYMGGKKKFSEDVIEYFMQCDWRGNIRELKNTIERAVIMSDSDIITLKDVKIAHEREEAGLVPALSKFINTRKGENLLHAVEKELIKIALQTTNGNKTKAAELLGIGRKSLERKIKKLFSK